MEDEAEGHPSITPALTTPAALLNVAPDMTSLRAPLFVVESPITLPTEQIDKAWKCLDNI